LFQYIFFIFFWLRVLDYADHSASESSLNSFVSYRIVLGLISEIFDRACAEPPHLYSAYYVISLMNEATPISYKGEDIFVF